MRPLAIMGVAALVVVASTEEGFTGTYGGVESNFEGVRFYVDASVGSLSDPTLEAEGLAIRQAEARRHLAAVEPQLQAMVRHFRTGPHPYRAAADAVVTALPPEGAALERRTARARITLKTPPSDDLMMPSEVELYVSLYARSDADEATLDRIAAHFVASQLFTDRAPPKPDAGAPFKGDIDKILSEWELHLRIVSGGVAAGMQRVLGFFRAHEDAMRVLAERGDPLARGLFATVGQSGQPLGAQLTRGLEHLDAERAATIVRILALVAPDTRRAEEARALRAFSRNHLADDDRLDAWLAEQAGTPTRDEP